MSPNSERCSLSVAIIIVSDTADQDPSTDKSRAVLSNVFKLVTNVDWDICEEIIVPDAGHRIQQSLEKIAGKCNLIITTGGTGFSSKDVTPEAVEVLLDKKAPGLV